MGFDWCRDITTKRESLLYFQDETEAFAFMNQSKIIFNPDYRVKLTNISEEGHGLGSVFLDVTVREETLVGILQRIDQQYPSRLDTYIQHYDGMVFFEINFDLRDPHLYAILQNGVVIGNQSVVIPCTASQVNAVYLRLYNLPLLNNDMLCDFVFSALSKYGNVLDIGMILDPSTNTYNRGGYAIIDTTQDSYAPLSHKVSHPNNGRQFYAVWEGMPDFCYCCHSKNHMFEECSERLVGVTYLDPVLETKMYFKEQFAFKSYVLFALNKDRGCIRIVVKTLTGRNDTFKVCRGSRILELHEIYSRELEISVEDMRFFKNRKQLFSSLTFADYNIEDGDVIMLV